MALHFLRSLQRRSNRPLGGHYEIIQKLGAGGFGHTFLAKDLHLPGQPICVLKQLKPHVDSAQALQVARRLFDTEAKVLYALGTHPQIPQLLAHFEDDNEFYLAQELIEGHSLSDEFTTTRRWSDAQVVAFLGDVLGTLSVVHQQRVIHRDLKPSNLMRRQRDQRIVLIDFGAVKQASTQLINSETGMSHTISIGTQGYMPNEQIAGMPQFSSDLYAVGVMGIQLLTGRHPRTIVPNPTTGELEWQNYVPQAQPDLVAFLEQMVRYDFRSRYATATDALAALQTLPRALVETIPPAFPLAVAAPAARSQSPSEVALDATPIPDSDVPDPSLEPSPDDSEAGQTLNLAPSPSANVPSPASPPDNIPSIEVARTQAVIGQRMDLSGKPPQSVHGLNRTITETAGATELATETQPQWLERFGYSRQYMRVLPAAIAVLGALSVGLALGRSGLSPSPSPTIAQPNPSSSVATPSPDPTPESQAVNSTAGSNAGLSANPQDSLSASSPSRVARPSNTLGTPNAQPQPSSEPLPNSTAQSSQSLLAPASPSLRNQLQSAEQLRENGQYTEAIAAYDDAIDQYPDATDAYTGRCYSLNFLQRYDEAIEACEQAIDLDKDNARALWSKGYALEQQQEYKDALKLYDKAIKKDPDFAEAWNNKGTALLKMDKIRDAVDAFDEAIALDPSLAPAWSNRGAALWGLREFQAALESVEQSLVLDPDNADALQLVQAMRRGLGN